MTIPQTLRLKFGLLPHTEVTFDESDGGVVVRPVLSKPAHIEKRLRQAQGAADGELGADDVLQLTRGDG